MTENKQASETQGAEKSKMPLIAGVIVAVLVVIGAMVALSQNGSAEENGKPKAEQTASASEESAAPAEQAAAMPEIKEGNPVVATVNGENVMRNDVIAYISQVPEQIRNQMPFQTLYPMALEQVINNKLIGSKAASANLETDPEVTELVDQTKTQIVRNVYVDRQIAEKLTDERLKKAYDDLVARMGEVEETKASHILVETEDEAKEIIKKLNDGGDFATLANENTKDPSGQSNGGELGWFAKNEMVPEFAEAAFAAKPGTVAKEPVQTQFGWHVIKVDERRKRPAPAFDAVKPQLEAQLRQQILAELVDEWQKKAEIEKFDINGEPVQAN